MCTLVFMGRTNIDIDQALILRVQTTYGLRTKREAVDFALRRLLVEPMDRAEALAMRGSGWPGDLDELRRGTAPSRGCRRSVPRRAQGRRDRALAAGLPGRRRGAADRLVRLARDRDFAVLAAVSPLQLE